MDVLRDISEELKTSYMDYAMSVIVGRALPDARDGLKPAQRRILYAMFEMGLTSNRPYRKCARIVGEVLGKYHPHGDAAVYDALVRLAQDFVMRYPLIDGQGNFGSIDGDSPAAMRYTEARLAKIADEMLTDINRETVDFVPNFDSTLQEPVVLPARLPNLLVNGCSGIAVGMATSIPPHNLAEVCDAIIACVRNPDLTVGELMKYIAGPDFPTGGIIVGRGGIEEAYKTGRGKITVRGRMKTEGKRVVIEEVPYMVNKAKLVESIAELAREGKIDEIRSIRDESDREGIRVVIELKSGAHADIVLKKLYAYTNLQTTFGITMLALTNNEPRVLTLKELIESYIEHRREVIRRRTAFELKKAKKRLHILEGLKKAVEDIDNAIQIIKSSPSPSEAKNKLMDVYSLTDGQADAILQMRLQKLTAMEMKSLMEECEELKAKISECEAILASPQRVDEIIIRETEELKAKYGDGRRTDIIHGEDRIQTDELIEREENILIISSDGFAKRTALDEFRLQARGGVGVIAANLTEKDSISVFTLCKSYEKLLLFTNAGRAFWIWAHEISKMDRTSRGVPVRRYIRMNEDERIVSALSVDRFDDHYVIILSPDGYMKKVRLSEFENAKRAGIKASGGEIAFVSKLESDVIFIVTKKGYGVKLSADTIPEYGRAARGVTAIRLRGDDEIAAMSARANRYLLTLTENGYGKRTPIEEFKPLGRGAMGIIAHRIGTKTGKVVFADMCDGGELFAVSGDGYCIRSEISSIPVRSRNSSGVIVGRKGIAKAFVRSADVSRS